jgi:hypothetical protein
MTTKLDKTLRREIEVAKRLYTVTLDPERIKIVEKGRRNGLTLEWKELLGGDAALAVALRASLNS